MCTVLNIKQMAIVGNSYLYHMRKVLLLPALRTTEIEVDWFVLGSGGEYSAWRSAG